MVTLAVDGQQGAGIHAIVSLRHVTSSHNFSVKILEPILIGTCYAAFDNMTQTSFTDTSVQFSDLFDIEHYI